MAQRSTGIFPVEGFSLDALMQVPVTTPAACPCVLKDFKTVKVIVLGATITGDADVTVTIGGKAVVIGAGDIDINGVAQAYIRGTLLDADNNMVYVTNANTGSVSIAGTGGVYLDTTD